MAKQKNAPKGGLTLGKGITIGVLSIVLLFLIVSQFGGSKAQVPRSPRSRTRTAKTAEPETETTSLVATTKRSENRWPTFDIKNVVASNPFMLPAEMLKSREAAPTLPSTSEEGEAGEDVAAIESADIREMRRRQAEFMASLRARGVDMILRSQKGSVARIGDLSLRVGDVHEGLRVAEIGQRGVVFVPADHEEFQPE